MECHLLKTLINNKPVEFSELSLYLDGNKQINPPQVKMVLYLFYSTFIFYANSIIKNIDFSKYYKYTYNI